MTTEHPLFTIGDLAQRLGVERHRVEYLIGRLGIAPQARAGAYRLFDSATVDRLRGVMATRQAIVDKVCQSGTVTAEG